MQAGVDKVVAGTQFSVLKKEAGTVFGPLNVISALYQHMVVKRSDGTVWAWGRTAAVSWATPPT